MKRLWIAALFCASGIVAGSGVVWTLREPADTALESGTTSITGIQHPQISLAGLSRYPDLWNGKGTSHPLPAGPEKIEKLWVEAVRSSHTAGSPLQAQLRTAVQSNTAAQRNLLQKYEKEQDPVLRGLLKSVLFGVQSPEILAYSLRLTESSNPVHKMEGFELLSQLPSGERQLRQAAMKTIAVESDPTVLHHVITALNPKVCTPLEVAAVTAKLHQLAQHGDVAVRRQTLELLSQWDRTANMENLMEQALGDPTVRYAAINTLYQSSLRSDNIKIALLNIVRGDDELTKYAALDVLGKFDLTEKESALYKQASLEMAAR